jgi:hypothetical protein
MRCGFVIGEAFWARMATVELECPTKKMFNLNGHPSATLTQAIRQIQTGELALYQPDYAARC